MLRIKKIVFTLSLIILASCGGKEKKSYEEYGSDGQTTRTEHLAVNLRSLVNRGTIIGQQYATLEGIGWRGDSARSDMHAVCGEGPAATCYELQGIESDKKKNTSGLAFSLIRKDALTMFRHGGLVTVTWQPPRGSVETVRAGAKRVAAFLSGLCDEYGIHVPVVFYPLPTGLGNWYDRMSAEQYYALYTAVMETLKDENVPNVLPGYAEAFTDGAAFRQSLQHGDGLFRRCPTAGETRPLAVNAIYIQPAGKTDTTAYAATLPLLAKAVTRFAQDRDLVPSLTTGIEGIVAKGLFSRTLLPVIKGNRLSYVLFGSNRGDFKNRHFTVPYPGCDNDFIRDFIVLCNDRSTIFIPQLNGLYL